MKMKPNLLKLISCQSSEIFNIFDRDSDGLVSREDIRSVTLNLGTNLSDRELDGFMRLGGKVTFKKSLRMSIIRNFIGKR